MRSRPGSSARTALAVTGCVLTVGAAELHAQSWTDWQTLDPAAGQATGAMTFGATTVGVSYAGQILAPSQTECGIPYFGLGFTAYDATAVRPFPCDLISISGGAGRAYSFTFSQPVQDLYMAFVSIGQPGFPVSYTFSDPFTIIGSGRGFWGNGPLEQASAQVLVGTEGHGIIRFAGTFTSLSFTTEPTENWHGFTVGAASLADTPIGVVPEPVTLALLATGLAGLGAARRRRKTID